MKGMAKKVRRALQDDPRLAIVLSEILGPPMALEGDWELTGSFSYPRVDYPGPREKHHDDHPEPRNS